MFCASCKHFKRDITEELDEMCGKYHPTNRKPQYKCELFGIFGDSVSGSCEACEHYEAKTSDKDW